MDTCKSTKHSCMMDNYLRGIIEKLYFMLLESIKELKWSIANEDF